MSKILQHLSFSFWLISLSIKLSRSIHVVPNGKISFFLLASSIHIYIWTPHLFFHSSVDGHLGSFCTLAIVNNAAMNIGVHVTFQVSVFDFFRYIPGSGIPGSYGSSIFSFFRKLHNAFYRDCTNLHSHQQWTSLLFSLRPH